MPEDPENEERPAEPEKLLWPADAWLPKDAPPCAPPRWAQPFCTIADTASAMSAMAARNLMATFYPRSKSCDPIEFP
jgi:hypothetical protein